MAIIAVKALKQGKRVLYAGPTSDQTERFWYAVRSYLQHDIDRGYLYKSETKRLIEPYGVDENGPRIRAKTAFNADALRGDWGNMILLDEYSIMEPDVDEVVLPMLLDKGGDVVYGGTPKRRNHFYKKYMQAKLDESGRWAYWHFTSHDNVFLNKAALEEITLDLTEDGYKQEILAQFLEGEGVVFRNIMACMHADMHPVVGHHVNHRVVMGVDWAKQNDYTVLSVVCADCKQELALERFNKISYNYQRERLINLYNTWRVDKVLAESNSIGEPNIDALREEGLKIEGFATTPGSKPPLIESLVLALEREDIQWINDPIALGEMEAYEMTTGVTGHTRYNAPEGLHDDTVIARALANRARLKGLPPRAVVI